jgi:predicted nucleic acid-binding protein
VHNRNEDICRLAAGLLGSGEPISFYDAFFLVRLARRSPELDHRALRALIKVHDHEATTVGGHDLLAEFLRAHTQRQEKERERARRVLSVRDHGATVRASVGTTLLVLASDAATTADAWSVLRLEGPAALTRLSPARAVALNADYELVLTAAGESTLELSAPATQRERRDKQLVLHVIAEPKS